MTIQTATPYLILGGKAERALEFYRQALGAQVEMLQRFGEVDASCPVAQRDRVMHAAFKIGQAQVMLSDGPGDAPPSGPGPVSVALDFDDAEQTRRCFGALAAEGQVIQPLFDAPWNALFGVCTDQYGVTWMLNCSR